MSIRKSSNEIVRLRQERLEWFLVAKDLSYALLQGRDADEAFDNYLRTRGRLEDPRDVL